MRGITRAWPPQSCFRQIVAGSRRAMSGLPLPSAQPESVRDASGQRKLRKRYDTSKQYLLGCFDWRSIDLLINWGDSANGSSDRTRYNRVVVRAREIEDSDNRSWPGSSTAEPVSPGGATTGLHFDIGPTAGAEKAALRSFNLRSRKQKRVHVEGPSITRSESTLVDHGVPPDASAGT
jgi:hypothetical protein